MYLLNLTQFLNKRELAPFFLVTGVSVTKFQTSKISQGLEHVDQPSH